MGGWPGGWVGGWPRSDNMTISVQLDLTGTCTGTELGKNIMNLTRMELHSCEAIECCEVTFQCIFPLNISI